LKKFYEILKTKTKIPIKLIDEVLSSQEAQEHMKTNLKMNRKNDPKV